MGNPFTEPTLTGYNANPPSDDGSEVASNEVTWSKHVTKLGDPLKTYSAAISTNVTSAFALIPFRSVASISTNTTVTTADRGKLYSCTTTFTLTLPAAATAGDGFSICVQNIGAGLVTVDGNSSETINGKTLFTIVPEGGAVITSNGTNWVAVSANNPALGSIKQSFASSEAGYLLLYGATIGNGSSGATFAGDAYEWVFEYLWDNLANGEAAVSSGRGTTAASDWAANKTITSPDLRGRVMLGKDNMGGSSANVVTDSEADTIGDTAGQETVTQTSNELVQHTHTQNAHGHSNTLTYSVSSSGTGADTRAAGSGDAETAARSVGGSVSSATATNQNTGSGNAQDIMNPYMTFNVFIRY